jgi:hypothetical protein
MAQAGRPPKYKTAEELQKLIDQYWENLKPEQPPTVTGLALALGMSRQDLINYQSRDEFFDTIKQAKQAVEEFNESRLITGNSVAGVIFNLKNNFNWKDKTEQEVSNTIKTVYIEKEEKKNYEDHIDSIVPKKTQKSDPA